LGRKNEPCLSAGRAKNKAMKTLSLEYRMDTYEYDRDQDGIATNDRTGK
jgi:hypothetical protein